MAIIALASLIGKLSTSLGVQKALVDMSARALVGLAEEVSKTREEVGSPTPKIVSVESDTWYLYHLIDKQARGRSFQTWADALARKIPRQYFFDYGIGLGGMPFAVRATSMQDGVEVSLYKTMGPAGGFEVSKARDSIIKSARGTFKAFIRSWAQGGTRLEED